jgi:hypothetical protein
MITKIDSFILSCDNCEEHYESHSGFGIFLDVDTAKEDAQDDEWITQEGLHYCPKCYHIDDGDNIIVKTKAASIEGFMKANGLGGEDMINDITYPAEL